MSTSEPIGIIAGGGQFPLLFAQAAHAEGRSVVAVGHRHETDMALEGMADCFRWVKLGQLGKILQFFKEHAVREAVFLGTITKTKIFTEVWPDLKGLSLWNKIDVKHDDSILRAIAQAMEEEGIRVVASTLYLQDLLFPSGMLTKKRPTPAQLDDIRFGWGVCREIGRLDIGQCVVVRDSTVLAVEAIEGTDAAIARGGALGRSKAVVVKVKKPGQDFRFDLPAIGPRTIAGMIEVRAAVLAVEAGQALFFDRAEALRLADKAGIVIVGCRESADGGPELP